MQAIMILGLQNWMSFFKMFMCHRIFKTGELLRTYTEKTANPQKQPIICERK